MVMAKRLALLALAAVMVVTMFAGCGKANETKDSSTTAPASTEKASAAEAPKKEVTIKIWGGVPAESGPDKVCENFNKEFKSKGIQATYERFVNDDSGNLKLDTALLAGQDIDLFLNYSMDRLKKRVSAGSALELTPYFQKDGFDPEKEISPLVKEYMVDGKQYVLPTTLATNNAWIVNKDMFDAANIPIPTDWTVDDLKDIAKKLTKGEGPDKVYGMLFATDAQKEYAFNLAAGKLGGDYLYKNEKESNFDSPDLLKALKVATDMMLVDKSAVSHADMITQKLTATDLFTKGKVAISPHSWIIRDVRNAEKYPHKFKTAFVPAPRLDKDQKDYYAMGTGVSDFVSISAKSSKKDEAWTYLKWYTTKGIVDMAPGGRFPAYKAFDKASVVSTFFSGAQDLFDEKSFKEVYLKSYDKYQINHVMAQLPQLQQIAREECEKAMSGGAKPEQAMQNAKKRADEILKK